MLWNGDSLISDKKLAFWVKLPFSSDMLTYTDTTSGPSQISPEPRLHIGLCTCIKRLVLVVHRNVWCNVWILLAMLIRTRAIWLLDVIVSPATASNNSNQLGLYGSCSDMSLHKPNLQDMHNVSKVKFKSMCFKCVDQDFTFIVCGAMPFWQSLPQK